jgi:two-component system sensor histidine kinase KdpD
MLADFRVLISARSHVVQKLAVLATLFILTIVGILSYTIVTLHAQKSDALMVDMAGRQRMLNQRHMKEVLLVAQGASAEYLYTRKVLNGTLEALINGGPAVVTLGKDETVQVPPAPTEPIKERLGVQAKLIHAFTLQADEFLHLPAADPAYSLKREDLLALNAGLQDVADEAVKLYAEQSEAKIVKMIRWETAIGFLVGVLGILLTGQIIQASRELEREIADRKQAEKELRISEAGRVEAFRQSDALKTALLSSVSHELRTPLTAMKTSVSSLLDHAHSMTGEMRDEFLEAINQEIDYLNRLVDNLLDMSRIEGGALVPRCEGHPLEDLVEGGLRRVKVPLRARPLEILLAEDLPAVFVDGVEVQQVFVNLLDNAIKYSPDGSPIRIEARSTGQEIEVRVSNSGEGIPPADLERVFQRFYRVRSGREHAIHGTGLGLAICKGIIEAHGGRIRAESDPGRQTTIVFTLPMTAQPPSVTLEQVRQSERRS